MQEIELKHQDCIELMNDMVSKGQKVTSVITSPPYAKQRDYNGSDADSYIEWFQPILRGIEYIQ